jgi:hypothetical protein
MKTEHYHGKGRMDQKAMRKLQLESEVIVGIFGWISHFLGNSISVTP